MHFWLDIVISDFLNFFCQGWQDGERTTCCFSCLSRTGKRIGSATLWIGRWIRIFSNMFWSCSVIVSSEKPLSYQGYENRHLKRESSLFVDNFTVTTSTLEVYAEKQWCKAWKLMLANKSADSNQRFQPFQPSSELVEKVDQPNQPKTVFSQ